MFVSKFTKQQISLILDEYVSGAAREDLCARYGITIRTFFRWKKALGRDRPGLEQRLAAVQRENELLRDRLKAAEISAGNPFPHSQDAKAASSRSPDL